MARGAMAMSGARELLGSVLYWALIIVALFGLLSTVMSAALFEGDERLTGTAGWAAFTVGAWVLARLVRRLLLQH